MRVERRADRLGRIRRVMAAHVFAGLPVTDYAATYDWYVRLFGRVADMLPNESEAVWRLSPRGSVYVVQDPARAGTALVTVALDDLDVEEARLRAAGVVFAEHAGGPGPRRLVVNDPDGNMLTFFQNPA